MKKKPTQNDVAKRANVSQTTVSHVLNNHAIGSIPEKTREKVREAVRELKFVPNKNAISLRTGHTYSIATVIPDIANPFYPPFLRGIQNVATENGYDVLIYDTNRKLEAEKQAMSSLKRGHVDGAIVLPLYIKDTEIIPLINMGLKVVTCGTKKPDEDDPIDCVYVDNAKAARIAVRYFIKKGLMRIGLLSGLESTFPQIYRLEGFYKELEKNRIEINKKYIQISDFTEEGGYIGMKELLKLQTAPNAVFAVDDLMAIGAMRAIKESGLRIPDDISIMGFDDIPAASLVTPRLTTITQHGEIIGRKAAQILFKRIKSEEKIKRYSLEVPVNLIVRESG
jgi:LacI family transcriptional regulator